jgi:hypothetical protein
MDKLTEPKNKEPTEKKDFVEKMIDVDKRLDIALEKIDILNKVIQSNQKLKTPQ